jgi:DNA-binding MarR family transcriptional regulator
MIKILQVHESCPQAGFVTGWRMIDPPAHAPDHAPAHLFDESSGAAMLAALRQLHAAIERLEALAAARLGVGRSDARCLALLRAGALPPKAIGARLGLTSGSVTALLDRLAQHGYVERRPDPADRRGVIAACTPLGAERLAALDRLLADPLARLAARYGPERSAAAARQVSDLARLAEWAAIKGESAAA